MTSDIEETVVLGLWDAKNTWCRLIPSKQLPECQEAIMAFKMKFLHHI